MASGDLIFGGGKAAEDKVTMKKVNWSPQPFMKLKPNNYSLCNITMENSYCELY